MTHLGRISLQEHSRGKRKEPEVTLPRLNFPTRSTLNTHFPKNEIIASEHTTVNM